VPDNSDLPVAVGLSGRERTFYRMPHGMELVIAGENLGNTAAGIGEDNEVL
jgi:hypothetical protein